MRLSAVIGANYGDEGKGHVVNHLSDPHTLVVRFNGGAQAGHTVVGPDGRRHIFHHIGSGTIQEASTFLSKHFIVNPLLFCEEARQFRNTWVFVDPKCRVTTPWDMMLNQAVESARGDKKHGSCGLGINETVVRTSRGYDLWYYELKSPSRLMHRLKYIQEAWVPLRAGELGVSLESIPWMNQGILDHFIEDCLSMMKFCREMDWVDVCEDPHVRHLVFEGAQGLRLDERGDDFPHVTRSRTGLPNVLELLKETPWVKEVLDTYYVTRPYLTRHGAGPLKDELAGPPYPGVVDLTNQPNPHQGTLRYAWLDVNVLSRGIKKDLDEAKGPHCIYPHLAVTCLDQVPKMFDVRVDGAPRFIGVDKLIAWVEMGAPIEKYLLFYGETEYPKVKRRLY